MPLSLPLGAFGDRGVCDGAEELTAGERDAVADGCGRDAADLGDVGGGQFRRLHVRTRLG